MQSLRRQATNVASAMLRRAESGSWASTSSSSSSSSASSIADAAIAVVDVGGLDRRLSLFQISRGFASRRPKVAVLLKEVRNGFVECSSDCFSIEIAKREREKSSFSFNRHRSSVVSDLLFFFFFFFFYSKTSSSSRNPKFILTTQDVDGLGEAGSTVSVRPGHARNALLPKGVAEILPHPRASRASRPPRAVLQQRRKEEEEEARRGASPAPSDSSSSSASSVSDEQDPASRLVAVARSLSKGAVEFVRPLKPETSSRSSDSSSSSSSSTMSRKIAEPIDAEAFVAAVAAQKRISLDPRLVMLGGSGSVDGDEYGGEKKKRKDVIDEQGEFSVPLRMKLGGERVVVRALVGLSSSGAGGGGGEDGGGGKKGSAKKKKGGKR